MAKPYKRKGSRFWWIAPTIGGVQVPQSSRTTDYEKACSKIKVLEGQVASGAPIQAKTDRKDFDALLELVTTDYRVKGRRSTADATRRIDKHISPAIGRLPINQVPRVLPDYILSRKTEKAAPGSINQELALIKRAFHLGRIHGLTLLEPHIEMLETPPPRQTAFSDKQIESIVGKADRLLSDLLMLYSFTGWRRTSMLTLEWSQVDLDDGFIALKAEQTKNRKATRFPLIQPLREIMERRKLETETLQKAEGKIIPWVFHRKGKRVKSIRKAFQNARKAAGLPGHRIHDFRRTAVRALHDLGYDVKTIMDMCGFKTEAMVHRYIGMTSDSRLLEAGAALAAKRGYK